MNKLAREMHKIKMKKRYGKGKKKPYDFKKTAYQRSRMKKGKTKAQMKKESKGKKVYIQSKLNDYITVLAESCTRCVQNEEKDCKGAVDS